MATVLTVRHRYEPVRAHLRSSFDVMFDQVVPKPICSNGPLDLIRIVGPVHFELTTETNPGGSYERRGTATAALSVTPVDPFGSPLGPTVPAVASKMHRATIGRNGSEVRFATLRLIEGDPVQSLVTHLAVGRFDRFSSSEVCGPSPEP